MNRELWEKKKSSLHAAAKRAGIAITSVSTFTAQRSAAPFISGLEHSRKKSSDGKNVELTLQREIREVRKKQSEVSKSIFIRRSERGGVCVCKRVCV